jgi:hypothetical protein
MMRIINSVQLMMIYLAMPYVITWIKDQDFYGQGVAFWVLVAVYVISAIAMTVMLHDNLKD